MSAALVTTMSAAFLTWSAHAAVGPQHEAKAQNPQKPLRFIRVSQAAHLFQIDIKPQSLAVALKQLSQQTGAQFAYPSSFRKVASQGVSGNFTVDDALKALLKGTKVSLKKVGPRTWAIQFAQSSTGAINDANPIILQGIVITGELIDRDIQDTQTSVTAISGEELEERNDVDFRAIAEKAANVDLAARGIGFVIRGVNQRGVGGNADGSGALVSTSIDGLTLTGLGRSNQTFLSTWDLEQVEILRGPQSTQTGSNALAGAVVIRSKDPTYEKELKVRAGYGNVDSYQTAFALNQPIIDNKLAVRLSADFNGTDGFITNPTFGKDDEAEKEQTTVRAAVRFDPTPDFSAVLKLSYINHFDGFSSSDADAFPNLTVSTNEASFDEGTYRTAHLRTSYNLTDSFTIVTQTSYVDKDFKFRGDSDGTAADGGFLGDDNPSESFEHETKLLYDNGPVKVAFGGYYNQVQNLGNRIGVTSSAALGIFPTFTITGSSPSQTDINNYAVFGEAEVEVTEEIKLIAGARYDRENNSFSTSTNVTASNPAFQPILDVFFPPSSSTTDTSYEAFLPKLGIVYEFNDDVSLGFTFQQGYRAGGANVNFFTLEQNDFDPEFTNNYELSFRSRWPDQRLTLNANAFYVDWTDQQVQVLGPSGNSLDVRTENAGKSRVLGGELEIRVQPIDALELYANVGYTKTEFLEYTSISNNNKPLAGNEFRNAPKFTGAIGGKYTFDNGLFAGADLSYTGAAYGDPQNTLRSDSRFLVDLQAGYKVEQYEIFGYVKNVFDVDYVQEKGSESSVTAGDPRSFGIVGQVRF